MKQLLEALDLALEALESERPYLGPMPSKTVKAITAIKQARSAPVQETSIPEGWERRTVVGFGALVEALDYAERKGLMPDYITSAWEGFNYLVAEKQARSAPVQEPVTQDVQEKCRIEVVPAKGGLLPAAQRQWVGLTDEEIEPYYAANKPLIKWVEAKLKEKNT